MRILDKIMECSLKIFLRIYCYNEEISYNSMNKDKLEIVDKRELFDKFEDEVYLILEVLVERFYKWEE